MNVVEGVDYIFDRYAFLGLPRDATRADIERAVRERRAENHPDRLVKAGEEVRRAAEQVRAKVDDAATILLNDAARPLYDQALARFEAEDPRLVTRDGTPVINPMRARLDLDYLLQDDIRDTRQLEEQAAKLSGYSERRLKAARRDHAENPSDEDARDALREELTALLTNLSLMEDFAWQRAGVEGTWKEGLVTSADGYLASVEARISTAAGGMLDAAVQARHGAVLIGVAAPPLLLAGPGGSQGVPTADRAVVTEEARRRFTLRAEDVREIARRKQAVLEELVTLTKTRVLASDGGSGTWDIYLTMDEGGTHVAVAAFRLHAADGRLTGHDGFEPMPAAALEGAEHPHGAVLVYHNSEISQVLVEVRHVAEALAQGVGAAPGGDGDAAGATA